MRLGFIGLGHMGRAMATRLLDAGHEVTIYNRSRSKAEALRARGARIGESIADACEAEAVITMVADDAAIESVVFGADGVLSHLPRGSIHVSSSTISVAMAHRLDEAHRRSSQGMVAAPVLGRPDAAEAGKLFVLAAGPKDQLARVDPVFTAIGQRTFELSDRPEAALVVKLSCNFLVASVIESMGEAMALVEKSGLDPHRYLELVTSTLFGAPAYKTYGELIAERHFEPAEFAASLGEKDIRLLLAAGESLRVPMPVASLIHDRFLSLLARGGEELDWSALGGLSARDAGLEDSQRSARPR